MPLVHKVQQDLLVLKESRDLQVSLALLARRAQPDLSVLKVYKVLLVLLGLQGHKAQQGLLGHRASQA